MARVMITCPDSGKAVYTHLNFNWSSFDSADIGEQSTECPECGKLHRWRKSDAYLEEDGRGD